jgi:hypothetical protein
MNWKTWKLPDYTKRRIAATMADGTCSARVLRQIETKARAYLSQWDRKESRYVHPTVKEVLGKTLLYPDRRRHKSKGKPKRDAMRAYVKALLSLYEQSTGKRLGRINLEVMDEDHPHYQAKHIPFIQVCVRAVGAKYPSHIIQELIQKRRLRTQGEE